MISLLIPFLFFSGFISDEAALSLAIQTYGQDARVWKIMYSTIITPFSAAPVTTTKYCVGIQEYGPLTLQTLFGTQINARAGQPLPELTKIACGSSWDDDFVLILKKSPPK